MKHLLIALIYPWVWLSTTAQTPLINGHSHNDYAQERPLTEALTYGFVSVEVDVHYLEGKFFVCHNHPKTTEGLPTLEELYLDPLRERVLKNKGAVYPGYDGYFYLMIDLKTDGATCYAALNQLLSQYPSLVAVWPSSIRVERPVKVFLSGNRPVKQLLADSIQYAGLDGRPNNLGRGIPAAVMPVVSQNYKRFLSWTGQGTVNPVQLKRFRQFVAQAHAEGKKVRLWDTPDKPELWTFLLAEGVDLINTDRLGAFSDYMNATR